METKIGIPQKEIKSNIDYLTTVLASEMVLYTKTRKFHWNVAGDSFMEIHKLFEAQYNELELIIDEVAERIGKLGAKAIGTMKEFIDNSIIDESTKYEDKAAMITELLEDYRAITSKIREFIAAVEETNDFGTTDFLTSIILKHESQTWILRRYEN
jgi:starvation-inducible DNA-binding protein